MKKKSPVSELMTRNVVVGNESNSLSQLLQFFRTFRIQHLPIVDSEENLVGIISNNDIVDYMAKQAEDNQYATIFQLNGEFKMSDIMTKNPNIVTPSDEINVALNKLAGASYQCLPVVENGKLVGVVTNNDLVKFCNQL